MDITYHFKFPETGEDTISYRFGIDDKSGFYFSKEAEHPETEQWAELEYCKCSNCPLVKVSEIHCPIARNLFNLVYFFKDTVSYKKATVFVETPNRTYAKNASVQEGLFSIFGAIMATSGCPHMDFLKPMARFHLPFASAEETIFRTASTYLLRVYLEKQKNKDQTEISLAGLTEKYQEVELVNQGILKRIGSVAKADCDKNAVVILNTFAQLVGMELDNDLSSLNEIFT